jgi:DNA ligase 1
VRLAELVATSESVAATRSRSAKIAALADLLQRASSEEVALVVGFLVGAPRQGKVGVGWASLGRARGSSRATEASLTVQEVDEALDQIQLATGPGSAGRRHQVLEDLFERTTGAEADFLRRLLMGELRHGALEGIMSEAVAKAAGVPADAVRRGAMFAGDLARVAGVALSEGAAGLAPIGLQVGQPVLPMLAATAATVGEALAAAGRSSVEWKLDGARIQAHRSGDAVQLFTRNLNDVTDRLATIAEVVLRLPARQVILDGEVFGAGVEPDQVDLFQDTMSRFSRHDVSPEPRLQVRFFDVLHLDGEDLIDLALEERLPLLERVAGPYRIPGILTDDVATAETFAAESLARGNEGVMVKSANSRYEAGRRGSSWRKVKPVHTLDLVVLAAEWGHGRRQGWLSNLHLGARNPAGDGFVMVGKTFKGLTDTMLAWQTERFLGLETERSGIAVRLRPELVVEIAVDGVQRSSRYPGGVALRFARVKRYREDKAAQEADTIEAVQALLPGAR